MAYYIRQWLRNAVSPYSLALVSLSIFLIGWIFPADAYTRFMSEPDLMFLDWETLVFYLACVTVFCAGVYFARLIWPVRARSTGNTMSTNSPLLFLLPPILLATILCGALVSTIGGQINLLAIMVSQQGSVIKEALHAGDVVQGRLDQAPMFATAVLWWAADRGSRINMTTMTRLIFRAVFAVGVIADIATCVAIMDRTRLLPLLVGLILIPIERKSSRGELRFSSAVVGILGGACLVVCASLALSYLRGFQGANLIIMALMGYTVVSYNRLAALLKGTMYYQYAGHGIYLFNYLIYTGKEAALIGFKGNWPSSLQLWHSEFNAVLLAGMNPIYIWSGTFGYLYSDLGWGCLVYLLLVGVMAGWSWSRFRRGTVWAHPISVDCVLDSFLAGLEPVVC